MAGSRPAMTAYCILCLNPSTLATIARCSAHQAARFGRQWGVAEEIDYCIKTRAPARYQFLEARARNRTKLAQGLFVKDVPAISAAYSIDNDL
jgi:hypothetical protein